MSKFKELIKNLEEAKKEVQKTAKDGIRDALVDYFKEHPEIKCLHWSQWTPYFNDGEPCEFRIHELFGAKTNLNYHGYSIEDLMYDGELEKGQLVSISFKDLFGNIGQETLEEVLETLGEGSVLVNNTEKGVELEVEWMDHD